MDSVRLGQTGWMTSQGSGSATESTSEWVREVDLLIEQLRGRLGQLPYDPTPASLYTGASLYPNIGSSNSGTSGFADSLDQEIYRRARISGGPPIAPVEELAQRLHDHGITVALNEFRADKTLVGVMGGHALVRGSAGYRQAVSLGRCLARAGYCVTTGGGPGAMEAANLGAVTSAMPESEVDERVDLLATVPEFAADPDTFVSVSLEVMASIPEPHENLSVPTWFYGHEPSNPFATQIAKYFSNSEREDGLLAIALGGIVFVRGGPGTLQEVFQDAAQNAYRTFGPPSPMVFLDPPDAPQWWANSGVLAALEHGFSKPLGGNRPGWDLVSYADGLDDVLSAIAARPTS